jgi:hypothetical protein
MADDHVKVYSLSGRKEGAVDCVQVEGLEVWREGWNRVSKRANSHLHRAAG